MATKKTQFVCSACQAIFARWSGSCARCKAWNTIEEQVKFSESVSKNRHSNWAGESAGVQKISEVVKQVIPRMKTSIGELDRVLGGGLVPGSVCLLGGDPGIGKSTLLLQVLANFGNDYDVLYVSGEESSSQIADRAQRLNKVDADIKVMAETEVEKILDTIKKEKSSLVVIDSIQTLFLSELASAPGSVAQVRESTAHLIKLAKSTSTALIIVGHVTKEGEIAGPKILEHMVDTVLYFEGDTGSPFRMLRTIKNRYGADNQMGIFNMTETGLEEVLNPSELFITAHESPVPGTVISAASEGGFPFLVELQALTEKTSMANPRRFASGLDVSRLQMILAVLSKHANISADESNVYVKAVGGVKLKEPASDLGVALALVSTIKGIAIPQDLVVFGEIGLAGELRGVSDSVLRIDEAIKLGYKRIILAPQNMPKKVHPGIQIQAASRINQALALVWPQASRKT